MRKIILLTIPIHLPRMKPGLKVQTSNVLSRAPQNHLRPQHQGKSQDLFAGTVEKWDIAGAIVKTHPIAPSVKNRDTYP